VCRFPEKSEFLQLPLPLQPRSYIDRVTQYGVVGHVDSANIADEGLPVLMPAPTRRSFSAPVMTSRTISRAVASALWE
jgi:hypothetical protein